MVAFPPGALKNFIPKDSRKRLKAAGLSDLLLDGDLTALSDLVYNNLTEVRMKRLGTVYTPIISTTLSHCSQETVKEKLFGYYAIMGMMDAFRLVRDSGFQPTTSIVCSEPPALMLIF